MATLQSNERNVITVGLIGLNAILVGILVYATWKSGTQYTPAKIENFVQEQSENSR